MEELAVTKASRPPAAAGSRLAPAPRDLREWMARAEPLGHIQRVKAEVDWDEEMGAITYMAHQTINAPALLFEKIRGCPPGYSALWNLLGSSQDRFALAIGEPAGLSRVDLVHAARARFERTLAPVVLDPASAPVNENLLTGGAVDVRPFPSARHWPLDGGRYIGTADAVITRDPEGGWHNVGTYRMMVHDRNHVGLYLSPGKDARLHIDRYAQRGEPCEVAAVWGVTPAMFIVGSQTFPKLASEYDVIGGIMGAPLELTRGATTSLLIPARAEVVMEGVIHPNAVRMEGPFGEFTGYYGRPEDVAPVVEVTAVHHRNNPIVTHALMADYPANECALLYSLARTTRIWNDLDKLGVPGIKAVYVHPAAGGFAITVISLEQRYAGHAAQVLALAAQCPGGAYYSKWVIAVDEDVDPTNTDQVLWAMSTRCNPIEDIDILRNTWSTWLDPTQNPPEERPYGSKALINACKEHRYIKEFSRRTKVRREMYERVCRRWAELGFAGPPPPLWALEDDAPPRALQAGA